MQALTARSPAPELRRTTPLARGGLAAVKRRVRLALSGPVPARLWRRLHGDRLTVFTLHRFTNGAGDESVMPLEQLDAILSRLCAEGYQIECLGRALQGLRQRDGIRRIVFSVDDGYRCFADAAQVFRHHGCRATVFIATDFVSGANWMWWDKLEFALQNTDSDQLDLRTIGQAGQLPLGSSAQRKLTLHTVCEALKCVSDAGRLTAVGAVAAALGVSLPTTAPPHYRALSWQQVRQLAGEGFEFAPHTVSHPVLSTVDETQLQHEINGSIAALRSCLETPCRLFSYPNGTAQDFGLREQRVLAACGIEMAMTTEPGYIDRAMLEAGPAQCLRLPRFYCPTEPARVMVVASGLRGLLATVSRPFGHA